MDKPDTFSDGFMFIGMTLVFVFLFRREIAAEWRELRGNPGKQRGLSGPLKRPFNPKPLDDWTEQHRK